MRRVALWLVVAGCGDNPSTTVPDGPPAPTCLDGATYPLTFTPGASHPDVVVVSPPGFDPTAPVELVVYLHGFNNCVETIIGDTPRACTPGGLPRNAYSLAAQLAQSNRNALLVAPEIGFDAPSGDPGRLADPGGFRAVLADTLAALPAPLGPLDIANHGTIVVAAHSGGYQAAAAIVMQEPAVDELWLFDALYGFTATFDDYVTRDLPSLATATPARRFANVYTPTGGTDAESMGMATRAADWVAGDPAILVDDRTTDPLPDASYHHGLIFKLDDIAHDDVPRDYFTPLLATSSLAARTCP